MYASSTNYEYLIHVSTWLGVYLPDGKGGIMQSLLSFPLCMFHLLCFEQAGIVQIHTYTNIYVYKSQKWIHFFPYLQQSFNFNFISERAQT